MTKIRITKEFKFEAAHALLKYDGLCKNIHGHSYKLFVTIIGEPNKDETSPKYGMVMDFGGLKKIVNEEIIDKFDHSIILSKRAKLDFINNVEEMFDRKHIVEYQPTCENMLIDFVQRIKKRLPDNVKLQSVKLYETVSSHAEWIADDND